MTLYRNYDITSIFQIPTSAFKGFTEYIIYLRPSSDDSFHMNHLYHWDLNEIKTKPIKTYSRIDLQEITEVREFFDENPCKTLSCRGCESDMGKNLDCFIPNFAYFYKDFNLENLRIIKKNLEYFAQFLQDSKLQYYLRLGSKKNLKFLCKESKDIYKNYLRIHIGLKSYSLNENFLRYNINKIIWTLTGLICRFSGPFKNRYLIYENPVWSWPQKIIINEHRHWYGYEIAIKNYLEEKGYKFKFQHGIIKDGFGNKKFPDFIIYPNEKYEGKPFIVEAKFGYDNYRNIIEDQPKNVIKTMKFPKSSWCNVKIDGLETDNEEIFKIVDEKNIPYSKNYAFSKILRQIFNYSELIYSDCAVILNINTKMNVLLNNKLIRFIKTTLYDLDKSVIKLK